MNKLKFLLLGAAFTMLFSCENKPQKKSEKVADKTEQVVKKDKTAAEYDPQRGLGKFTAENITLGPINAEMAAKGNAVAQVKCFTCHKPTTERLVGPGWKGVTQRHTAPWIMNFISNPNPMINVDPSLQAQLEICLVRMPNQGLTDTEAREILEYMRQLDSK